MLYAPIIFVMYYLANWIWFWTMLVEKWKKEACVTLWKENYLNTRTVNEHMMLKRIYIEILMIYGMINLHNQMNFVKYLDVFTIHIGVSFPLIVLIHVTWIVNKKNPFLSNGYISCYCVPYMLILIIVVSTSLNEQ